MIPELIKKLEEVCPEAFISINVEFTSHYGLLSDKRYPVEIVYTLYVDKLHIHEYFITITGLTNFINHVIEKKTHQNINNEMSIIKGDLK